MQIFLRHNCDKISCIGSQQLNDWLLVSSDYYPRRRILRVVQNWSCERVSWSCLGVTTPARPGSESLSRPLRTVRESLQRHRIGTAPRETTIESSHARHC